MRRGIIITLATGFACWAQVPYWADFQRVAGPQAVVRAAQVRQESGFNPGAQSPVGAQGIAQFMPSSWRWAMERGWVPPGSTPQQIVPAIQGQHRYMVWLEARTGEQGAAWGAYNAGLGSIRKAQEAARLLGLVGSRAWMQTLVRVTGPAHSRETVGYVQRIETIQIPWVRRQIGGKP